MPKEYISNKKRILDYIENIIVPLIKKQIDLDYYKVLDLLKLKTGASEREIEEALNICFANGILKHIHILTIPDDQIDKWLKDLIEQEKNEKKELNKVEEIIGEIKEDQDAKE